MSKHHAFQITLFIIYISIVTAVMIWQGIGIDPSRFIFLLLIPTFFIKRTKQFFLDWIPFLFIFLSYEFLRGFTPFVNPRANYTLALNFDKWLFGGQIPTITLQQALFNPHHLTLLDYLCSFAYSIHLGIPFFVGFALWLYGQGPESKTHNQDYFKRFSTGIISLSYAGWLTFLAFPAAPPWLAFQKGLLPYVYRIQDFTSASFPDKFHLPSIYHNIYPNNVAAIPSMHAAYPMIVLLYLLKFFGRKAWFALIYVLLVWFALIYLGEHYFFDEIIGGIYALVIFLAAEWLHKHHTNLLHLASKLRNK